MRTAGLLVALAFLGCAKQGTVAPEPARLKIVATPSDASVYIDGHYFGRATVLSKEPKALVHFTVTPGNAFKLTSHGFVLNDPSATASLPDATAFGSPVGGPAAADLAEAGLRMFTILQALSGEPSRCMINNRRPGAGGRPVAWENAIVRLYENTPGHIWKLLQ